MKSKIIILSILIGSLNSSHLLLAQCVKSAANAPSPASGICSPAKPAPDIPQGDSFVRQPQNDGGPQDGCFGGPPFIENTDYVIAVGETLNIEQIPGFYNSLWVDNNPLPFSFTGKEAGEVAVPYLAANGEEWVTDGLISITVNDQPDCVPGIMPDELLCVCADDSFQTTSTGAAPLADETLVYVLHNGNDVNLGTIYAESTTGNFINNDNRLYNQQLCVSAVILDAADNTLRCISNCQQVILYAPVKIETEEICAGDKCSYEVRFTLSGGAPQYDAASYTYTTTGDYSAAGLLANQVYTFGSISSGNNYQLNVINDGKGCEATFESEVIDCKKLPISLLAFEGEALETGNLLKWSTASEIENDYFRLTTSTDGIHFETIHTQAGAGTVSDSQSYQYLHRQALGGKTYYHLSQTDFDGTETIAGVLSIIRGETILQIIELRPNPAYEELLIGFSSPATGNISIQIKDLMGRVLVREKMTFLGNVTFLQEMSYFEERINLNALAAGLYLLELSNGKELVREKFIKR